MEEMGDMWIADGYGEQYVHRYNKSGDYISSINGEEGQAGPFGGPHALWIGGPQVGTGALHSRAKERSHPGI